MAIEINSQQLDRVHSVQRVSGLKSLLLQLGAILAKVIGEQVSSLLHEARIVRHFGKEVRNKRDFPAGFCGTVGVAVEVLWLLLLNVIARELFSNTNMF